MSGFSRTSPLRDAGRRGFTLAEMSVAIVVFVMVMASVLALQYISARTIKDLYGPMHSRSTRMNALNQIRLRLVDGKIGSCAVSDSDHRLRFQDPNKGAGVTSEFYFNAEEESLYYDDNIAASPEAQVVAEGAIDITFTLGSKDLDPAGVTPFGTDAVVGLHVRTSAELAYSNVDQRDGDTVVYLRNP
jgi:prepilin-type N-terminal cleavage/methylation domain-containing protein